jgi:predicted Zn finger-like uncharacterized protein
MIVQCEECQTKFNVPDGTIGPEGAWLRCSKCQHVFHLDPSAEEEPAKVTRDTKPLPETRVDLAADEPPEAESEAPAEEEDSDDLDLDMVSDLDLTEAAKGGRAFRVIFWLLGLILVVILVGMGGLVAMDRLGLNPDLVQQSRKIPGVNLILDQVGVSGPEPGGETQASKIRDINLVDHRVYIRSNVSAGRLLVIQGKVTSQRTDVRYAVRVRGRLLDREGRVVSEDEVYAGSAFNANELRETNPTDMKSRLSQPKDPNGNFHTLKPKGHLPFMIIFVNPPGNVTEFTAEVVGSELYQP